MSQLLPSNNSLLNQKFSDFVDRKTKEDYSSLSVDPLLCHLSVLPHLALDLGITIKGMPEDEARKYLDLIQKTLSIAGTVGAVDRAITFFLKDGRLVEWFEDENLKRGFFRIQVYVSQRAINYEKEIFDLFEESLKKIGRLGQHLKDYEFCFPDCIAEVGVGASSHVVEVHPFLDVSEVIVSEALEVDSVWSFDPTLKSNINETINSDDINLKGGYIWNLQIEA